MIDAVINQPFSTLVAATSGALTTDAKLFVNGTASSLTTTVIQVAGSTTQWVVTFTPNATGVYSFYCFGQVQFRVQVVLKSMYAHLKDIEDSSLGSWHWDKATGGLTLLRSDGSSLATFTLTDTLVEGSRERLT